MMIHRQKLYRAGSSMFYRIEIQRPLSQSLLIEGISQHMQQLKSSVRRFWNAMQRQKAETAMKFRAGHSIFFENIAEGPVGIPIY